MLGAVVRRFFPVGKLKAYLLFIVPVRVSGGSIGGMRYVPLTPQKGH